MKILILLFVTATSIAKPIRFEIRDAVERNSIQFTSNAPLEKVTGLSTSIIGWIELDPEKLSAGIQGEFQSDLRTFDTGIDLRNIHLKDRYLSTAEQPQAQFAIQKTDKISAARLENEKPVTFSAEGRLKFRGVERFVPVGFRIVYFKESERTKDLLPGNLLKVSGTFPVELASFGINIPENLKLRIASTIDVAVDAVGTDHPIALGPLPPDTDPKKK